MCSLSVIPVSFSLENSLWMGLAKLPEGLTLARLFLELKEGLLLSLPLVVFS